MKKFLSMALALAMTLSLCTFLVVTEAGADFEDQDQLSSKYAEQATAVIQKIEVMDGYDDNTFRPTAGLTRQAAAKIICNMILGPTTAKALPTTANPFPDVLAGNQFSGYISYCSQQGIISGYADGTFRGGDPLSGYAYLKMLLGALGYKSDNEGFTGDNWKVNVAKLALGIGLNKGIETELDGATQVTREEAAIYAFNTLQADMVEYDSKNSLEINGVVFNMGGGNATPQTWNTSSTSADYINNAKSDGNNQRPIVQFAERYFDKLRREPNEWDTYTPDDFGRPAIRWFWKGVEIGTYSRDPDVTFVGNVKVNAIYEGLEMSSGNSTANLYINSSIPNNERLNVARSNDRDLDKEILKDGNGNSSNVYGDANGGARYVDRIGDGTLIECFRNDANNHVDVCVISVYGGKVSAVKPETTKKNAYVTIDWGMDATATDKHLRRPNNIDRPGNNEYETVEFEEDDVVAYTYSDSDESIKSMYLMTAETGVLQSRVHGKSLRLDDVTYSYGKEYTFHDITDNENGLSSKSSYVVYMDENDYALWIEEDEFAVDQYVLIERISIETTSRAGTKTTTASVLGGMETAGNSSDPDNDPMFQTLYQQSKTALGNSTWDARARLRFSNGTVRTVTLDDSRNYRTSTSDDRATNHNGTGYVWALKTGSTTEYELQDTLGNTIDVSTLPLYEGENTGNGTYEGNWISRKFTAGNIVRATLTNGVYKLHSIIDTQVLKATQFGMDDKELLSQAKLTPGWALEDVYYDTTTGQQVARTAANAKMIVADSETHFAIDDVNNSAWKTYVGLKNAPDVAKQAVTLSNGTVVPAFSTTAYIYHRNGLAKLIFVTGATVSSSGNDIVFLVANSASNLITATDIDNYYTVAAVEKNEVKTIMVKAGTTVHSSYLSYRAGGGKDNEANCVLLNDVNYDSNDLMNYGIWDSTGGATAYKARGIRRLNAEEIRVDTHTDDSIIRDLDEGVKVYFVDGSDIERIEVADIVNDTSDYVYYVMEKGEVTNLFIVNYDSTDAPAATTDYWADGELELLDPSGDRTNYIYHYAGDNTGMAKVRDALKGVVNSNSSATVSRNGDAYNITLDGIVYTVTPVQDAHVVVRGLMSPNATISSYTTDERESYVVYAEDVDGDGFIDADRSGYLAGTTVKLSITPVVSTDNVTVEVYDREATPNLLEAPATSEAAADGTVTVTFTVPSVNFEVKISAAP